MLELLELEQLPEYIGKTLRDVDWDVEIAIEPCCEARCLLLSLCPERCWVVLAGAGASRDEKTKTGTREKTPPFS